VRPGQLVAGEYPRDWDDNASRRKLQPLLAAGVDFFLDLTEAGEYGLKPYVHLVREEAAALGLAVEHRRMPIADMNIPRPDGMVEILDTIEAATAAGHTVYVHCFGGIGRTGTVVGCYLVRQGMSGEEALREIARLRRTTPDGWNRSPQTEDQCEMVRTWPARK